VSLGIVAIVITTKWGILPALQLPNHFGPGTNKESGTSQLTFLTGGITKKFIIIPIGLLTS
jgi:hypothetical protein